MNQVNLKSIDTHTLAAELRRREKSREKLIERRDRLLEELDEVERELEAFGEVPRRAARRKTSARRGGGAGGGSGGGGGGAPRRRAQNEITLGDALAQAMEVRAVVTPTEAAELVKANGYTSTSKNFAMMVSNTLAKDKRFKRIARGQYERIA